MITNFHNKKVREENVSYKCLSIIILDSVFKWDKKHYPQTFLEECKKIKEKIKTRNYIDDELKPDSVCNDETEADSDSNYDETKSDNDKYDE